MKNWLTPLLIVVSLFVFAGCTNTSEIIATGLKIELARVEHGSDGAVQVTWRVKNPNIVPYLIDRVTLKVTLDGVAVGTVTDIARVGLPPQSQAEHTGVLVPANAQAAGQIAQLAAKGSASYQVSANIALLIYDDEVSKSSLTGSGTVPVATK